MGRYRLVWTLKFLLAGACGSQPTESTLPLTAEAVSSIEPSSTEASSPVASNVGANSADAQAEPVFSQPIETAMEALPFSLWKSWAPRCQGYPSKQNCDDGDATLFSGLLCLAGETVGCEAVKAAQDNSGRFWRSPRRVGLDTSNSFSRDMALGVLAYLVTSKDTAAAQNWLKWIDQNSVCQFTTGTTCQLRTYRYCRDDSDGRCFITPGMWSVMRRVWEHLNLPLHKEMKTTGENILVLEAEQAAIGYQLHLKAVMALIYQKLERNLPFEWDLANILAQRQPDNLFFRYLQEGSSDSLKQSLRSLCPSAAPQELRQWTWERDTNENAQAQSMGWDCIFLGQLLLHAS